MAKGIRPDHLFQSAPLTEARGDPWSPIPVRCDPSFNPLPLPKQGETHSKSRGCCEFSVSIRSPYRSKGRRFGMSKKKSPEMFQSAPLTEARGDKVAVSKVLPLVMFQSAPLTEARGDLMPSDLRPFEISFNPLPLPKQGETHPGQIKSDLRPSFNPLPLPKQGETFIGIVFNVIDEVSIRSPYRSKGRRRSK